MTQNHQDLQFLTSVYFDSDYWNALVSSNLISATYTTMGPAEIRECCDLSVLINAYFVVTCPVAVSCTRVERMVRWVLACLIWQRISVLGFGGV